MASSTALLAAATFTLFSSALAFSPDQCNITAYGAPTAAACTSLLATISNMGVGNTSYVWIPSQYPTPAGINGTRKEFPQTWSTTGCKAALVPQAYDYSSYDNSSSSNSSDTGVTYDTSTYPEIASRGSKVVQHCVSNSTAKMSGGWVVAGDFHELVLHIFAAGSQIDTTLNKQTKTEIAATSEAEVDAAAANDPNPEDGGEGDGYGNGVLDSFLNDTTNGHTSDATNGATNGATSGATNGGSSSSVSSTASVVKTSSTFNYLACEADSPTSRTLSSLSWSGQNLTVERCADYCTQYKYMGVEFGSQCYCGGDANGKGVKSATSVTSTQNQCTTPCNGDAEQICGGNNWLSVYQNSKAASAGATA